MSAAPCRIDVSFAVAGQLAPQDIAAMAAQGFRTIINNRPDDEGGASQPSSEEIARAAREHGVVYVYQPIQFGAITESQALEFARHLESHPHPVLAFCRTGTRSANLYRAAKEPR